MDEMAIEEALDAINRLTELRALLRKILNVSSIPRGNCNTPIIAVDGSYAVYGAHGLHAIVVKAAIVVISADKTSVTTLGPLVTSVYSLTGGEEIHRVAEELMIALETIAVARSTADASDAALLILDGPIADPPRPAPLSTNTRRILKRLLNIEIDDLHRWRASMLSSALRRLHALAGYVKRPSGSTLLTRKLDTLAGKLQQVDDAWIAGIALGPGEATSPERMPPEGIYQLYYTMLGGIEYTYAKVGMMPPARLEVAPIGVIDKILGCLSSLTKHSKHPLPIQLAHEKSLVSLEEAKTAHRLITNTLIKRLKGDPRKLLAIIHPGLEKIEAGGEEATLI
ncbi:NurA domain protein [Pyrolobus fumarii 1A]|uniref:NurA domain protein n=2 Tax=Pyrolobus fumarii TaxID=54252 RepID=G0EE76_PYRF1|nr:NurA domain protein [Pyrolobus fumarii 1A]